MPLLLEDQPFDYIRRLAPPLKSEVRRSLDLLGTDPSGRRSRLDVRQLETDPAGPAVFRLAVKDHRFAYLRQARTTRVFRAWHRREGYGWLADFSPADLGGRAA